jgi:hypothetical protein
MSISKKVIDTTTKLNFDNVSDVLRYVDTSTFLNFDATATSLQCTDYTTCLNFDIDSFDSAFPKFKVLLDFIDSLG